MKLLLSFCLLLTGCSSLVSTATIAPPPVTAHVIAFSGSKQNAGIAGYDSKGLYVDSGWVGKYDIMLAAYDSKLSPSDRVPAGDRTGILPTKNGLFHVTWEVNTRYSMLQYIERNNQ